LLVASAIIGLLMGTSLGLIMVFSPVGILLLMAGWMGIESERRQLIADSKLVLSQKDLVEELVMGQDAALFVCDSDTTVRFANKRAKEIFKFVQPIGQPILKVTLSHEISELISRAGGQSEPILEEIGIRTDDDRVFLVKAWRKPEDHRQLYLSMIDMTQIKRLERVRSDFVANVSHELRTPLTNIRAMSEILSESDPEEKELFQRYLGSSIREVDRLTRIVEDLLTLSLAERGKLTSEICDLTAIVDATAAQLEPKANSKGLQFRKSIQSGIEVNGNPSQLAQIVFNLVDNAINYTREGSVQVHLEVVDGSAKLTIQDTGIGVPSEDQPRVFERFYRVDKSRSKETGGTGLGLSIVKHLVEIHGGHIELKSALNQGSTFTIWLTLSEPEL